jgi:retinol dehydrogenase-12
MDLLAEAFPPKPHWTADDVPDMTGKVVAVTGYGGIGYYTIVSFWSLTLPRIIS